jgi:PAS domain S-box-containing protein
VVYSACVLTALTDITERKQAEAVLVRYHLLSERARDIMLFIRPDGQIVEANAAAIASYGYNRAALLTKNIRDLRDPSTAAQIATQMSEADAGGTLFTTIHRRSDGSTFPVEVSSIGADIGGEHLLGQAKNRLSW